MDFNNAEVLEAFSEGIKFGYKQGWDDGKEDDARLLKGDREEPPVWVPEEI